MLGFNKSETLYSWRYHARQARQALMDFLFIYFGLRLVKVHLQIVYHHVKTLRALPSYQILDYYCFLPV